MDTIMNYLENTFMNFPQTPEVVRAKEDLAEMMEDKYNELTAEGKLENEAVGIVISEFGNIQELADELGIQSQKVKPETNAKKQHKVLFEQELKKDTDKLNEMHEYTDTINESFEDNLRFISNIEAEEYLFAVKQTSIRIAAGVMLCIYSPILLILLFGMKDNNMSGISDGIAGGVGISALLLMSACAVGLFIHAGMKLESYEYLKKECFTLDKEFRQILYQRRESGRGIFMVKIIAGVVLCILSVVPMIMIAGILGTGTNDFPIYVAVALLLIITGIAVSLFITAGMWEESYKIILQEKEYSIERKRRNKWKDTIEAVYWPVITAIYLFLSFTSGKWGTTWIIWPLAGILFEVISGLTKMTDPNKQK